MACYITVGLGYNKQVIRYAVVYTTITYSYY
jgi:hypothetical protein